MVPLFGERSRGPTYEGQIFGLPRLGESDLAQLGRMWT